MRSEGTWPRLANSWGRRPWKRWLISSHRIQSLAGTVSSWLRSSTAPRNARLLDAPASTKSWTTWREVIRIHMDVLVATDCFTAEVWTKAGLVTYGVLFFIHLASRKVHVAGITPHPDERWMVQIACNVTMADWGFLEPG